MQTWMQSCKPSVIFNNVRRFKSISLCGDFAETGGGKAKLPKQKAKGKCIIQYQKSRQRRKKGEEEGLKRGVGVISQNPGVTLKAAIC